MSVLLASVSFGVHWNESVLDIAVEFAEVNIREDRTHDPPLGCSAQGAMILPILKVSCL